MPRATFSARLSLAIPKTAALVHGHPLPHGWLVGFNMALIIRQEAVYSCVLYELLPQRKYTPLRTCLSQELWGPLVRFRPLEHQCDAWVLFSRMDFPSSLRPTLLTTGPLGLSDVPDMSFMCSWRDALTLPESLPQTSEVSVVGRTLEVLGWAPSPAGRSTEWYIC